MGDRDDESPQAAPRGRAPLKRPARKPRPATRPASRRRGSIGPSAGSIQQAALTRLARALADATEVSAALTALARTAVEALPSATIAVWLPDDGGDGPTLAARGADAAPAADDAAARRLATAVIGKRAAATVTDRGMLRLGAPLLAGGRVLGALTAAFPSGRGASGDKLAVLTTLAAHAAGTVARLRQLAHAEERQAHLARLLAVNTRLSALGSTDALLSTIAEEAAHLLGVDNAGFRVLEGDDLVLMGLTGTSRDIDSRPRIKVGESLAGRVVAEGRTLVLDIETVADAVIPEHLSAFRRLGYTAFLGVPLRLGGEMLGVLTIRGRRAFTTRDRDMAEAFAAQAAVTLQHARLYEETERARRQAERRARNLTTLSELTGAMASASAGDRVFDAVAMAATALFGAKLARVWVADQAMGVLRAEGSHGIDLEQQRAVTEFPTIPFGQGLVGPILESGRPEYVLDIQDEPRWLNARFAREFGLHTFVGLPLGPPGRRVGVLAILFGARREWSVEDAEVASLLANQATIAIANAELGRAREERAMRMRALVRLNQLVSSALDTDSVLTTIVNTAADLVRASFVHLWVADEARGVLEIGASTPGPAADDMTRRTFRLHEGATGWVAEHRLPLELPDIFSDARFVGPDWARRHGLRSFYGLPVLLDGQLLGVLVLMAPQPLRLTADDRELLDAFAAQAAIALRNAQLYREARESSDRLRAVEQVNRLISSSLDVEAVLGNVSRAVAEFFDAPFVSVWSYDAASRRLHRSLIHGDTLVAGDLHGELGLGEGAVGWVVQQRAPIPWTAVADDPRVVDAPQLLRRGLGYFAAYPIAIGDRVLGAFAVSRGTPPAVTPETASLIGSLAAQAAVALDHARLYAETARRLDQTAALLEVAEILTSTLDARQLLKRAAITIAQVTRVERCSIEIWDGDRVIPLVSQFADGRKRPELWEAFRTRPPHVPRAVAAHARAIETRRAVVIDDTAETDLIPREWIDAYGLKSYMVVPLMRQDAVIGVMNLDYSERPQAFAAWQVDLAMAIAGPLALALENTRLYDEARERLRETTLLLAVGQALRERAPDGETMRGVAREVCRAFGADMVGAYFLDERRDVLRPLAGYHVPPELVDYFQRTPIVLDHFPLLVEAAGRGKAVGSGDPLSDARFDRQFLSGLPPHSVLLAPAISRGIPIGALFLVWWRPGREFSTGDVALIEAVAQQVGLAMENADLARQTETKLRETQTLLSVSRALGSTLDLSGLLRHLLRHVHQIIGSDSIGIWTVAADGDTLEPLLGYRVPPAFRESSNRLRPSVSRDPFYREAAQTLRPVVTRDAPNDPRLPAAVKEAIPHRSQLFVPMVLNDRMAGGIAAVWFETVREFSADELALLEAIASHAAVAIEQARLFQENRRQVGELSVLHDLARAITGQLDRAAVLHAVYGAIARVLDVRNMVVLLRDAAGDGLEAIFRVRDGEPDPTIPRRFDLRAGLAAGVIRTGQPLRTDDYVGECARSDVDPQIDAVPFRYWLGVPLRIDDRVVGALALRSAERPFTAADELLLANIGDLAAAALRTADLFEERARAYRDLGAAQDQLVRTEKLRALGEMASGIAHDFNNLLAAILGRAQLVLQRITDPKLRQWVTVIERAALDGAQTVRRLQEFTRIRRDEPLVAVDVNRIVRETLEITQSRWRDEPASRGVTIRVESALGDVPEVAGDAAELREALTNLVLNAVDAMPDGGTLTLETAAVAGGVTLVVSDTGLGMPEAVRSRIFDPFFTTKGPRGTGLGLSITYGILSRHGASVDVQSAEGRGTSFRLVFPRGERLLRAQADAAAEAVALVTPLSCLVVDDDEAVGSVVGDMIEASGHRALVLADPAEAIARMREASFDVVFTDLAMPVISGWEVARAARATLPDTPVFMMTGFGVELSDEERLRHGLQAVLVKPLRIEDILDALRRAAERRSARPLTGDRPWPTSN
ncbi:MAG: GAF domain-containing protein [Candidatus Rokubacteria bacterium]|nr:GAF domain-containing protein [Candidatus Rokubacteria bacterium]